MPLPVTILEVFERLKACRDLLILKKGIPDYLKRYIHYYSLLAIYDHLLLNQGGITEDLKGLEGQETLVLPLRIAKETGFAQTGPTESNVLSNTVNFIVDRNFEIAVVFEVKGRVVVQQPSDHSARTLTQGASKKVSESFRIDIFPIQPFVTMTNREPEYITDMIADVSISHCLVDLCKQEGCPIALIPFQDVWKGAWFLNKNDISRLSLYAPRVEGNLNEVFLRGYIFEPRHQFSFANTLLFALTFLERHGFIHQDVNLNNILMENQVDPCFKLIDFGLTHCAGFPKNNSVATPGFESPEISRAHRQSDACYNRNFWGELHSYGRYFAEEIPDGPQNPQPNTLNDSWAFGVTLAIVMNKGKQRGHLAMQQDVDANQLLSCLLEPDPAKRYLPSQAFELLRGKHCLTQFKRQALQNTNSAQPAAPAAPIYQPFPK